MTDSLLNRKMNSTPDPPSKEAFLKQALQRLQADEAVVLDDFLAYQNSEAPFFDRVEVAHEFLDVLSFKIKESKSRMSKDHLTRFSLDFLRDTLVHYGYNPKFIAIQCKALITYYLGHNNLEKAIEVCEFLIRNGITDDDCKGFHVHLDELYHLKKRVREKGVDLRSIRFPDVESGDDEV